MKSFLNEMFISMTSHVFEMSKFNKLDLSAQSQKNLGPDMSPEVLNNTSDSITMKYPHKK